MKKDNCIFCKIINNELPSWTLYEDERFRVILNRWPVAEGHALILPKEHFENIYDLPEDWCADLMKVAKKMSIQMKKTLHCDGINLQNNNEVAAGQTIFHFHMHLIPRYQDNAQKEPVPVIGLAAYEPSEEALDEVCRQILTIKSC